MSLKYEGIPLTEERSSDPVEHRLSREAVQRIRDFSNDQLEWVEHVSRQIMGVHAFRTFQILENEIDIHGKLAQTYNGISTRLDQRGDVYVRQKRIDSGEDLVEFSEDAQGRTTLGTDTVNGLTDVLYPLGIKTQPQNRQLRKELVKDLKKRGIVLKVDVVVQLSQRRHRA